MRMRQVADSRGSRDPLQRTRIVGAGITACGASSPGSAHATPTATPFVIASTATPTQVTQQLDIPPTKYLYPSPDGTLLVAEYDSTRNSTLNLYNLAGQEQGAPYSLAAGEWVGDSGISWFNDSSGLLIPQSSGPLLIMDRQGNVHSTGLTFSYPQVSQDGRWIGGTGTYQNKDSIAEIAPRAGGPVRVLAQEGMVVGWQNNRAIYCTGSFGENGTGGYLYAFAPNTGASQQLAQISSDKGPELTALQLAADSSPDGQVLILQLGKMQSMMLVGNHLLPCPSPPVLWVGQHDTIAVAASANTGIKDYVIEDIITGKVVRDTGVPANLPPVLLITAVSGNWLVTTDGLQPPDFTLVNDVTKASYPIIPDQNGILTGVSPVGNQGKFLVTEYIPAAAAAENKTEVVLVDATSLGK